MSLPGRSFRNHVSAPATGGCCSDRGCLWTPESCDTYRAGMQLACHQTCSINEKPLCCRPLRSLWVIYYCSTVNLLQCGMLWTTYNKYWTMWYTKTLINGLKWLKLKALHQSSLWCLLAKVVVLLVNCYEPCNYLILKPYTLSPWKKLKLHFSKIMVTEKRGRL